MSWVTSSGLALHPWALSLVAPDLMFNGSTECLISVQTFLILPVPFGSFSDLFGWNFISVYLVFYFYIFNSLLCLRFELSDFFFLAAPKACISFQARNQTHAIVVTTLDPKPAAPQGNSWTHWFYGILPTVLLTEVLGGLSPVCYVHELALTKGYSPKYLVMVDHTFIFPKDIFSPVGTLSDQGWGLVPPGERFYVSFYQVSQGYHWPRTYGS